MHKLNVYDFKALYSNNLNRVAEPVKAETILLTSLKIEHFFIYWDNFGSITALYGELFLAYIL